MSKIKSISKRSISLKISHQSIKIISIPKEDKKHYLLNNNKAKAKENKLIIKAEIETVKSKKAHIKYLLIFNYSFLNKK